MRWCATSQTTNRRRPPTRVICIKRIVIGLTISVAAVAVTTWSLVTYVPNVPAEVVAVGSWFATFYTMTLVVRSAVREAYHTGEVDRRLSEFRRDRTLIRNEEDANAPATRGAARSDRVAGSRDESPVTASAGE